MCAAKLFDSLLCAFLYVVVAVKKHTFRIAHSRMCVCRNTKNIGDYLCDITEKKVALFRISFEVVVILVAGQVYFKSHADLFTVTG